MANGARDYYRLTNGTAIIGGSQASHTGEVTSYLGDVQNAPGERYVETGYRNGIKSGLSPSVVQNDKGFPEVVGHDGQKCYMNIPIIWIIVKISLQKILNL